MAIYRKYTIYYPQTQIRVLHDKHQTSFINTISEQYIAKTPWQKSNVQYMIQKHVTWQYNHTIICVHKYPFSM